LNTRTPTILPTPRLLRRLALWLLLGTACLGAEQKPALAGSPPAPADLRAFLMAELQAGKQRIVIPPGRYPIQAQRGSHLTFSGLRDVEIIADQVELVCGSTLRAVLFENCTNVTLRGLTVDYDPLPFTQGTIIAMAPDKSWIDFEVADGYPDARLAAPFQIYDPASRTLRRGDGRWNSEIISLGPRRHRVTKALPYRFHPAQDLETIGDTLVAKSLPSAPGSPHAFELRRCRGVRLEDITLYASPSFGFLERGCHGTTYLRCTIDRRAPEDDPVQRSMPRLRSLNADAFHSKDATKGPAILSCKARFQGDDAVNINGRFHYVRSSEGARVRIAVIDRNAFLREGDPVQFLPYEGPLAPHAKVLRSEPDPEAFSAADLAFLRRLRMDEKMRASLLEGKASHHILTLDREVDLPPGSLICCPLRLGNGFRVKDCDFGETRSRGILIKASNGEITGNRIAGARMHAILVSPEFWWMEAGLSSDLLIRDNRIQGCRDTAIRIQARGGNRQILPAGALRNIAIRNNRLEDCTLPLIHVTSTTGLTIHDNLFPDLGPTPPAGAIVLEQCLTSPASPP
jgi:hypothetical protein